MGIFKPAVTGKPPITVTASGTVSTSPREVVAIHYLNTTAGAGRVDIRDENGENRITLGSDAQNGNDDFCPSQPMRFNKLIVNFTTGTGVVTILTN